MQLREILKQRVSNILYIHMKTFVLDLIDYFMYPTNCHFIEKNNNY